MLIPYLIYERFTGRKICTIEDEKTGALRDVDAKDLDSSINLKDLVDSGQTTLIQVNNMSNTGGKLVTGLNDLYTYCKKYDKQDWLDCYNSGRNELPPTKIAYSSGKLVKIACPKCGLHREITPNTYLNQASCICQSKIVPYCIDGLNDLYTYCTEHDMQYLLDEYDDVYDIHTISYGSHTKLHWKCKYGHEWDVDASHRINAGSGCPYCKGAQTSRAERTTANWLKENNIKIIEREKIQGQEFDIHIVDYNILIEFNSDATHSSDEQREKDSLKHQIAESINCKLIVVMQNCFVDFDTSLYYDIIFKYNSAKALDEMIENLRIELSKHGLNIESAVSNKAKADANKNDVPFERSIAYVYPGIENMWGESNIVTPDRLYASCRQYVYLNCITCGQKYSLRGDAIKQSWNKPNKGCPYCSGKKVIPGLNDLATFRPDLVEEWSEDNPLTPYEVSLHSNKMAKWVCKDCGHTWMAAINNRTGFYKEGCPACAGKVLSNGEFQGGF